MSKDMPYPLTITRDRYTGAYSGAKWTAWNCEPNEIPEGPFLDDVGCAWFWEENKLPVGLGRTPSIAILDLMNRLEGSDD